MATVGLIFNLIFNLIFSFLLHAAPADPVTEAQTNLAQLKKVETQLKVALMVRRNLYAQSVYADGIVDLFKSNPQLYFNSDFMQSWFLTEVSHTASYRNIAIEYAGYLHLLHSELGELSQRLSQDGLFRFLSQAFPQRTSMENHEWILERVQGWKKNFVRKFQSEHPEIRETGFELLERLTEFSPALEKAVEAILPELSVEGRIDLANQVLAKGSIHLKVSLSHLFLMGIPFEKFQGLNRTLFGNLLGYAAVDNSFKNRPGMIAEWLAKNPVIAQSRLPILFVYGENSESFLKLNQSLGFTVVEQLFLTYESFRTALWNNYVLAETGELGLRLIDLAIESRLPGDFSMGQALMREHAMKDPRWIEWMLYLSEDIRSRFLLKLTVAEALFNNSSEKALELQKAILQDALKAANGNSDPIPLSQFIRKMMNNGQLVQEVLKGAAEQALKVDRVSVTRALVENLMFDWRVNADLRMTFLKIILSRPNNDQPTLKRLAEGFNLEKTVFVEMMQAQGVEAAQNELLRQLLTETLIDSRTQHPFPFCSRVFSAN